jgi:hypothetical protein
MNALHMLLPEVSLFQTSISSLAVKNESFDKGKQIFSKITLFTVDKKEYIKILVPGATPKVNNSIK